MGATAERIVEALRHSSGAVSDDPIRDPDRQDRNLRSATDLAASENSDGTCTVATVAKDAPDGVTSSALSGLPSP